jgi:phosphatidate cytidylyltransferase
MLRARLLTALPLAAGVLALIWFAPSTWVSALFALVALLGAWEWVALCGRQTLAVRLLYVSLFAAVLAGLNAAGAAAPAFQEVWGVPALIWWLAVLVLLLAQSRRPDAVLLPPAARMVAGLITLSLAWLGLVAIHTRPDDGAFWLTVLFSLVWGADIGAYFAGHRFGRLRLAPAISPGKTWEGVAGGIVTGLALMVFLMVMGKGLGEAFPSLGWLVPTALIVMAASVVGDLGESVLKRWADVKDSGRLLPGHGGVLDRVDALLAAAPVMATALMQLA